jgi:type III pantothenate kinase
MTDPSQDRIPDTMPHILACDVGNSAIHLAHVCGEEVSDVTALRMGELGELGEALRTLWQDMPEPKKLVAASVAPAGLKALEAAALEALGQQVTVIGRELELPMETDLPSPESTGVDRLCAAAAAFDRLGKACVIADFGTAITVDCVNDEGVFLGGAILPGLEMSAKALHQQTARLPEVDIRRPDWVFGRSTADAIAGGIVHGARGALRELVEAYATALGSWPLVIATGGSAKLVVEDVGESDLIQAIVPDLALRGVAIGYYRSLVRGT